MVDGEFNQAKKRKGNSRFRKTRTRGKDGKMRTVYRLKRCSPAAEAARKRSKRRAAARRSRK